MNKKNIPSFSLARQVEEHRALFLSALESVLDSQQFIGGTYIEHFEKMLAEYLGVKHAISCNSGTDALWIALHALQMPPQSIVLTTPFSFIASSSEIAALGAHPVFIDIELDTLNINPLLLEKWLMQNAYMLNGQATHKITGLPIVGILPVDIFGQPADYGTLTAIAQIWNLWIIEDCAQALGATIGDKKAGTFGTIGAFSFYPTKNLGAFGDAGCCVTDDDALAEKMLITRNHGRKSMYNYTELGINSRLDAFQAAILLKKLPLLNDMNERRRAIAARYNAGLSNVSYIKLPQEIIGTHVYHQYSILIDDSFYANMRNTLEKYLATMGIQTRIFYPQTLPSITFLQTHPALTTMCPLAEYATKNILALPMWPELLDEEIDYIINIIKTMPLAASTIKSTTEAMR